MKDHAGFEFFAHGVVRVAQSEIADRLGTCKSVAQLTKGNWFVLTKNRGRLITIEISIQNQFLAEIGSILAVTGLALCPNSDAYSLLAGNLAHPIEQILYNKEAPRISCVLPFPL